ncbi:MAG: GH-E family nuclease, partial [Thermoanaerobaculia bacterium]
IYLHSGEVETSGVDLIAGGRASAIVAVARSYRSRTIGWSPFGLGWDSSIFRRLRRFANGDVEFRDGSGEVWTFKWSGGAYQSPPGLFLKLERTAEGWTLLDINNRLQRFDERGRIVFESDEFYVPGDAPKGNTINYFYDASGRLSRIVDPVGRATTLAYWDACAAVDSGCYPGLVREIEDWRGRRVNYEYDTQMRLSRVVLPAIDVAPAVPPIYRLAGDRRPRLEYNYAAITEPGSAGEASREWTSYLNAAGNLVGVREPAEVAKGSSGKDRVRYQYYAGSDAAQSDRVVAQVSPCAGFITVCVEATATLEYSGEAVRTVDAFGQLRSHDLVRGPDGRMHPGRLRVHDVAYYEAGASLPLSASVDLAPAVTDLTTTIDAFNAHGQPESIDVPGVGLIEFGFGAVRNFATRLESVAAANTFTKLVYDTHALALGAVSAIAKRAGEIVVSSGAPPEATRDAQTPHRDRRLTVTADDEVLSRQIYSVDGQLVDDQLTDMTSSEPKRTTEYDYFDAKQPPIARGRVAVVNEGKGSIVSKYDYRVTASGGEIARVVDQSTNAVIETETDALGRAIREEVRDASGTVLFGVVRAYDASGRVIYTARKQGDVTVTETWTYDPSGRAVEHRLDNAVVDGARASVVKRSRYDLTPTGMVETSVGPFVDGDESNASQGIVVRDRRGRPVESRAAGPDGSIVRSRTFYDKGGRVSYESDGLNAVITRYDGLGRPVGSVDATAVQTRQSWTAWNEPDQQELLAKPDGTPDRSVIARSRNKYSKNGSLDRTNVQIDLSGQSLSSWTRNFGGSYSVAKQGHAASVDDDPADIATNVMRGETTTLDLAGRVTASRAGAMGVGEALITDANTFAESRVDGYRGAIPTLVRHSEPRAGATYTAMQQHDALGRVIREQIAGGEAAEYQYDEAGNTLRVDAPGFPAASATYDARGLLLEETRPDGSVIGRKYDARGDLTEYRDETGRVTSYTYDGLGRLARTAYPDGTSEEVRYLPENGAVHATRDRAGVWIVNEYDVQGRVAALRHGGSSGAPVDGGPELVRYTYDAGSRVARVANPDSAIEYEDYDWVGRPQLTRFFRYKGHTGLSANPELIDRHAMEHRFDVFGQVTSFRMPAAVAVNQHVPDPGVVTDGWFGWIGQTWDAGGNLVAQRSLEPDAAILSNAESRGIGRLAKRVTNVAGGVPLSTFYTYADALVGGGIPDETGVPPPPYDGTLAGITVWANGMPIAGSDVRRDAARRITRSDSNGLPGRTALFAYDDAGRLTGDAVAGRDALESPGLAHENLYTPAEFRQARATRSALSAEQIARLDAAGEGATVPRGWTATENAAHAIESRTVGATELDYVNAGGRRVSDGVWSAGYDELGRLTARTRTTGEARRIEYQYDPNDRLIGRIALQPAGEGTWTLETRTTVLARDGLPAETTFVWDPVTDRLLAIYEAGKSIGAIDPNAGLLKQYLHGDQGYDDPTHVFVRNTAPKSGEPAIFRHRIVVDPLAGGSVTTVVDPEGHLVERVLYADAYGDAPRYLHGAVVDKISVHAEKDGTGAIAKIVFRARLSERIDPASLATGARLEAVRGDGSTTPAPAAVTPELFEETTVQWTLTGAQWSALSADATSIRLAITSDLRTPAWGNRGPTPAPGWAQTLFGVEATATQPVVWRESVARIESLLDGIAVGDSRAQALYAIPDLYLAAAEETRARVGIAHHAYPFVEPGNEDVYVRARWYIATDGSWLTSDPMGYADSSSPYAGFITNPLSNIDPTGEWVGVDNVVAGAVSVGIGWGMTCLFEKCSNYSLTDAAVDFSLGFLTTGLSSINKLKHLSKATRWGLRVGSEITLDMGAEWTRRASHGQTLGEDYSFSDLTRGALVNAGLGEGGALFGYATRRFLSDPYYYKGGWRSGGKFVNAPHKPNTVSFARARLLLGIREVRIRFHTAVARHGWSVPLRRPHLRAETRRAILARADVVDGRFRDANTFKVITGKYHIGHVPNREHRRLVREARAKGMNQAEFNDWVNAHPEWFQVEDVYENLSHRHEVPGVE